MSAGPPLPETRVLAVASHVVSGNVGNKIAVFAMQSLGCDVAALNTVQFSNHTGYQQWTGTCVSAAEIDELWKGLRQSHLDGFDMMLSGYVPGATAVEAVGRIGRDLQAKAHAVGRPADFFWVLDPVMGDNGKIYVAPEVVPEYKKLLGHADLVLPNEFEAELLSGVEITDMDSLGRAIQLLHERYGVPHVVITSVSLPHPDHPVSSLSVVGSTMTSSRRARPFKIVFPAIDCYFCGTGDLFGSLMVVRMREAVWNEDEMKKDGAGKDGRSGVDDGSGGGGGDGDGEDHKINGADGLKGQDTEATAKTSLRKRQSWISDDSVAATNLPLARAVEKVLASMHEVLTDTGDAMRKMMDEATAEAEAAMAASKTAEQREACEKELHLLKSRAAELRLVRNLDSLRSPQVRFKAVDL